MASLVERMLDLAEHLIRQYPKSGAARRRAVSTAYYAAFHALMKLCTSTLVPDEPMDSSTFERVYRALDHGPIKQAFQPKDSPLSTHQALRAIGELIVPLQSARMKADYAPPRSGLFKLGDVEEHITQARNIVEKLNALNEPERRILAIHLIFKDRNR